MKLDDIIKIQKETGDVLFVRHGSFYNAYNEAAFFLGHLRHYQVKEKRLRDGSPYYQAGFPPQVLQRIIDDAKEKGGEVVDQAADGSLIRLHGVDTSFDEKLVTQSDPALLLRPRLIRQRPRAMKADVEEVIMEYDIANKTPMEAMIFLNELRNLIAANRQRQAMAQEQKQMNYEGDLDTGGTDKAADGFPEADVATDDVPFADAGTVEQPAQGTPAAGERA